MYTFYQSNEQGWKTAHHLMNVMLSGYLLRRKIICQAHWIDWELETLIIFEWLLDKGVFEQQIGILMGKNSYWSWNIKVLNRK